MGGSPSHSSVISSGRCEMKQAALMTMFKQARKAGSLGVEIDPPPKYRRLAITKELQAGVHVGCEFA